MIRSPVVGHAAVIRPANSLQASGIWTNDRTHAARRASVDCRDAPRPDATPRGIARARSQTLGREADRESGAAPPRTTPDLIRGEHDERG